MSVVTSWQALEDRRKEARRQELTRVGFWDDQGPALSLDDANKQIDSEFAAPKPSLPTGAFRFNGVLVKPGSAEAKAVANMAKAGKWVDPSMFKPSNVNVTVNNSEGGENYSYELTNRSAWRGAPDDHRTGSVSYMSGRRTEPLTDWGMGEALPDLWEVDGGHLPGQKRHTRVKYQYDKAGNLTDIYTAADTKWYEDAAPLLGMALTALTAGGAGAALGSSINSGLGLGLGTGAQTAVGNAALGAAHSALTGGNPIRSIAGSLLAGTVASQLGRLAAPAAASPVGNLANRGITGGISSALSGGNFADGLTRGLAGGLSNMVGIDPRAFSAMWQMYRLHDANKGLRAAQASATAGRRAVTQTWF